MTRARRTPNPHDVLTTDELARWLRRSRRHVERMRLPTISPGRYLFSLVLEELRQRAVARRVA